MVIEVLYYFMPLIGLLPTVVVHCISVRLLPRLGVTKGAFLAAIVWTLFSAPFLVWMSYSIIDDPSGRLCSNLIQTASSLVAGYCYFHSANVLVSGLRVRLIEEIGITGATQTDIMKHYNDNIILEARLVRLLAGGHLMKRDDRLYVGKKNFILLYSVFDFLKFLYLGSSFDIPSADKYASDQ